MSGVQRFLSGHKNHVRTGTFTGPVKPITDAVLQKPLSRQGSSSATIDGTFTATEEAQYEIEVLDTVPTVPLVTAPIFSGVGNGVIGSISAVALGAREIEVELTDLGNILTAATAELQGVQVTVTPAGANGNAYKLRVDRTGLIFTPQAFSLLSDVKQGDSALVGPEFDWDTKYVGPDGVVPTTAHRITFGPDTNNIYVQYKKQVDGKFSYIFEPELSQDYPAKSIINFVTGGYTVRLYEVVLGVDTLRETYAGITTLYDLLNAIKTTSTRLLIQGAVVLDRTTGGQALLELFLNTDARAISNTGVGSTFASGFTEVAINSNAPTELVEATCIAATFKDAPGAGLGNEIWEIRGSVSGLIRASVKSGDFISADFFDARIPQKVPDGYSTLPKGSFTVKEIAYNLDKRVLNPDGETYTPRTPPICLDSMTLGLNASEQIITLVYKKRPLADECACTGDINVALSPDCLGVLTSSEGGTMAYTAPTVTRLVALYDWFADSVRDNSAYANISINSYVSQDPFISQPAQPASVAAPPFALISLFEMVQQFETTLASVDKLPAGAYRTAAEAAWDVAVAEFKLDVDTFLTGAGPVPVVSEVLDSYEALAIGDAVMVFQTAVSPSVFKIRKALSSLGYRYGFVKAAFASGVPATMFFYGDNVNVASTETTTGTASQAGWRYMPSVAFPGKWVLDKGIGAGPDPAFFEETPLVYISVGVGTKAFSVGFANLKGAAVLADRHRARLQHVLISGGISPLGKGSASDNVSGDGCWQDNGAEFWWEVTVNEDGYAPAFTGVPYYSAKKYPGGVVVNGVTTPSAGYYTTKEFGFIIDVPCADALVPGDTIVLKIGNASTDVTYVKGDKLLLGIVAAQDIAFFGGKDGDNVQTWFVSDSVLGPRPPYLLDTDLPVAYVNGGLSFLITPGALLFVKGDKFNFSIEGGHFRWRSISGGVIGAWSGSTAINITPLALNNGLSLHFELGTSPAFFTGDVYKFTALQPYALSNIVKPDFDMWQWGTANPAASVIDFGASKLVEAIGIAFHSIPVGATILVEGGVAPGVYTWNEPVVWAKDVIGKLLAVPQNARYVRITVTNGVQGGIGWLYVGEAVKFSNSAQVTINREYKVNRSEGLNPSRLFKGQAIGSEIQWPEGYLNEIDYAPLVEMIDFLKRNDDEALLFFPQESRQTEVVLGSVESDAITINDVYNFQPGVTYNRRLSCTIPLKGVAFK